MNSIEPLSPEMDMESVAYDLSHLLADSANADVADEFPASVARYTGELTVVQANLEDAMADCAPGIRQQFVAFSGHTAVGMSVIRFAETVPEGIQESWPNVSGFICHPYRAQGLGTLSLQTRLHEVDQQFGGNAWTRVRDTNMASTAMVTRAGFEPVSQTEEHTVYAYRSMPKATA